MLYKMRIRSDPYCHLCNNYIVGSCLHMFWECPMVVTLWTFVCTVLSDNLHLEIALALLTYRWLHFRYKYSSKEDLNGSMYYLQAMDWTIHPFCFNLAFLLQRHCLAWEHIAKLNGTKGKTIQSLLITTESLLEKLSWLP